MEPIYGCICNAEDKFLEEPLRTKLWWHEFDCPYGEMYDSDMSLTYEQIERKLVEKDNSLS